MQTLFDRQAVADVLSTYAATIDESDMQRYRALFDESVEVHGFTRVPLRGLEAWIEFVAAQLERFRSTQHMLGPQLTRIEGDRAHARTDLQATHRMKEPEGELFILWATYETDLLRHPDTEHGWKIVRHELVPRARQTTR